MNRFTRITKRFLAGTLAALLVLTSAPSDVFAQDFIDDEIVNEIAIESEEMQEEGEITIEEETEILEVPEVSETTEAGTVETEEELIVEEAIEEGVIEDVSEEIIEEEAEVDEELELQVDPEPENYASLEIVNPDKEIRGKKVSDLQSNVAIGTDNKFYGTLNYIDYFEGYSSREEECSGYYLAVKVPEVAADHNKFSKIQLATDISDSPADLLSNHTYDGIAIVYISSSAKSLILSGETSDETPVPFEYTYALTALKLESMPAYVDLFAYTIHSQSKDQYSVLENIVDSITLSVNDVKIPTPEITDGGKIAYVLKSGDKYTLNVNVKNGINLVDYAVGIWDKAQGSFVYGKCITIKNNTFTYTGTAKAGTPVEIFIDVNDPDQLFINGGAEFETDPESKTKTYLADLNTEYALLVRTICGKEYDNPHIKAYYIDGKNTVETNEVTIDNVNLKIKFEDGKADPNKVYLVTYCDDTSGLEYSFRIKLRKAFNGVFAYYNNKKVTSVSLESGHSVFVSLKAKTAGTQFPKDIYPLVRNSKGEVMPELDLLADYAYDGNEGQLYIYAVKDIPGKYTIEFYGDNQHKNKYAGCDLKVNVSKSKLTEKSVPTVTLSSGDYETNKFNFSVGLPKGITISADNGNKFRELRVDYTWGKKGDVPSVSDSQESIEYPLAISDEFKVEDVDATYVFTAQITQFTRLNSNTPIIIASSKAVSYEVKPTYATTAKDMTVKQVAKTAYSGQKVLLANIKYGKGVTYVGTPKVTCDTEYYHSGGCDFEYDAITGNLYMTLKDLFYCVDDNENAQFTITAPTPEGVHQPASKTLKVKILTGANYVEMNNNRDLTIYKAQGKTATASFNSTFWYDYEGDLYPAATKKADYKVYYKNTDREVPGISAKNGKITVAKNYVITDPSGVDTYDLVAYPVDYPGNPNSSKLPIHITAKKQNYAEAFLVKHNDSTEKYDRVSRDTITIEELCGCYMVVRTSDVAVKNSYAKNELVFDCSFKVSSSAVKLQRDDITKFATIISNVDKPVKNITFTATAEDSSKVSVKSAKYNVVYSDRDEVALCLAYSGEEAPLENTASGDEFSFTIRGIIRGEDPQDNKYVVPSDYSVSFTNGKKIKVNGADANEYAVTFKDFYKPIEIKITDKRDNSFKIYKVLNNDAPQVLSVSSLFAGHFERQTLEIKVKFPETISEERFNELTEYNNAKFDYPEGTEPASEKYRNVHYTISNNFNYDEITVKDIDYASREATYSWNLYEWPSPLDKGKYKFVMVMDRLGVPAAVPITIEVKSEPKATFKPDKNGLTLSLHKDAGSLYYDVSNLPNVKEIRFPMVEAYFVDGKPTNVMEYFYADPEDGKFYLRDIDVPLSEVNSGTNNKAYAQYQVIYNDGSISMGYTYITIEVYGAHIEFERISHSDNPVDSDDRYGVNIDLYQSIDREDIYPYEGITEIHGCVHPFDGTSVEEWVNAWGEDMAKGLYYGFKVEEAEGWNDEVGNKVEIAKAAHGTAYEQVAGWKPVTPNDNIVIAYIGSESIEYDIYVRIVDKDDNLLDKYLVDLSKLEIK